MSELDTVDRKIIKTVLRDGRITNAALSEAVGLSPTPCLRRVRALEDRGIITGYAARVSEAALGFPVSAFVSVKLTRQTDEELRLFEDAVRDCAEVVECYLMTGQRDYMMRVVARGLSDYERFLTETLTRIPCVASIESSLALRTVKSGSVLPLE